VISSFPRFSRALLESSLIGRDCRSRAIASRYLSSPDRALFYSRRTERNRNRPSRHTAVTAVTASIRYLLARVSFYRESSFIRCYFILLVFYIHTYNIYTYIHALRVCRIVFDNVQFDSVLYTFVFARRYIENTISFVPLSLRLRRINKFCSSRNKFVFLFRRLTHSRTRVTFHFSFISISHSLVYYS